MSHIFKIRIDDIPVVLEIIKMGPASDADITTLTNKLSKEDANYISDPIQEPIDKKIKIVQIGDGIKPVTPREVNKVNEIIKAANASGSPLVNIADMIEAMSNEVNNPSIDFWQSKTFWVNVVGIVAAAGAYFGFDFKSKGISEETIVMFISTVVGIVNIYLRKGTNREIKSVGTSVKSLFQK